VGAAPGDSADPQTQVESIPPEQDRERPIVYVMIVEDAIGTVTDDRIREAIGTAVENDAELLVIKLNTPGGFTRPTWSICKNILNSDVPVCMYIAPSGARAGSAGVYMTYAAHFAAMAPSTNIGAAHPVAGSGAEVDSVMNEKITNDAVAQIKAAAEERGRNKEWAEKAVRESVSITDREALELNVVNIRAKDLEQLLDELHGRTAPMPEGGRVLYLRNPVVYEIEETLVQKILSILSSPDVAFILFSLGGLGLVIELYNPGAIFPGVVGAICLILAFFSFQTLPINYAGVALIGLAILLFILEIKVTSAGLLTVGGLISLFLGGMMLIDSVDPVLQVSWTVLITTVVVAGVVLAIVATLVVKAARSKPFVGNEHLIGTRAEVRKDGLVYLEGALWKAKSDQPLSEGDTVEVSKVDGLTVKVKKVHDLQ
jgi:membrane-bound serine protease (ClpP class)